MYIGLALIVITNMEHKRILSINDLSKIVHDMGEGKEVSTEVLYQAFILTKEMQRKVKAKIQSCTIKEESLLSVIAKADSI